MQAPEPSSDQSMGRKSKLRKLEAAAGLRSRAPATAPREPHEPVQPIGTPAQRWVNWLVPSLIAFLTSAAFLPTLQNHFVDWDDYPNLLDNFHYRGLGWTHLRWMWTTFHMGHYIPLTWMTFGVDYLLWGLKPFGYHLTSLLLHAANAAVFYFAALRLLKLALPGPAERNQTGLALSAGVAALLFALHPLRVGSVAWATERGDVLSGLFYLLTLLVYLRACEPGAHDHRSYWWSVGLFVCALLSKSMAVSLPVVLLILDVYPLRRLGGPIGWWSAPARRVYAEKIPFGLLALAASTVAFLALLRLDNMASLAQLSVLGRVAVSAYSVGFYLWKMFIPLGLSPLYALGPVNPWAAPFLLSYGVVLALSALALALRRRVPGLLATWLAYLVILLPVLGIFHNGPQIGADRYTYLAGLGWAILAGAALLSGWRRLPFLLTGAALCVLLGLGALTWNQAQVWRDTEKLWTHALALDPQSWAAQNALGVALAQQGKLTEAIEHFRQALRIGPDYARVHNNWGEALRNQDKPSEAIDHFREALRIRSDYPEAHNNWGAALAQQGKTAEAIEHYRQALRISPDYAEAHNNLGAALALQGKMMEAIGHFRRALGIKPDYADAHSNWGLALTGQGKLTEAIDHFGLALRINPDDTQVQSNLLNAFMRLDMGKGDAAPR